MGRNDSNGNSFTILDVLDRRAVNEPNAIAYRFISERAGEPFELSYGDLRSRALTIAGWLQSRGHEGEPVALVFPPGLDFVLALFGTLYARAIAVPLDAPGAANSAARFGALLENSNARVLLTTANLLGKISRALDGNADLAVASIAIESVPDDEGAHWRLPGTEADDLAILQYTSGSTALPKGVMVRHGNLQHNLELLTRISGHDRASVGVSWLPQYHDMGLVAGILMPVHTGFPVTLMSPASFLVRPVRWLKIISQYRATVSGAPNFAYEHCVRKVRPEELSDIDLTSWRIAYSGAEPIRPDTIERFSAMFAGCGFRKTTFFPCYGLAEATLLVSGGPADQIPVALNLLRADFREGRVAAADPATRDTVRVAGSGSLNGSNEVIIVDPHTRRRCEEGRVGEIWISGASVASGYWKRPRESEETFGACLADDEAGRRFLRSGDLGFIRDGVLFVSGRLKDLIIIRGMNHYPQDIEQTVEDSCAALRRGCGAAFSIDDRNEEKLVIAYEPSERTARLGEVEFRTVVRDVAERHGLQIHSMVLVKGGSIPRTTSGKIRRQECRAGFLAGTLTILQEWRADPLAGTRAVDSADTVRFDLSQDDARVLAIIIDEVASVLGVAPRRIDPRDSIYALGLDSLAATRLRGRLLSIFGVELDVSDFLAVSTLADLADQLVARLSDRPPAGSGSRAKRLLEQVAQLSEKDVEELLAAEAQQQARPVSSR